MLIQVYSDRMGNLHIDPVNAVKRRAIFKDMKENGYAGRPQDTLLFLQEGMGDAEFRETLRPSVRRDLEHGWTVRVRIDDDTFRHMCGYYCY